MATPATTYTPDTTPSVGGDAFLLTADGFNILTSDGFKILMSDHGSGIYTADSTSATSFTTDSTSATTYTED